MLRTINALDKRVLSVPTKPVVVPDKTATTVLPDTTKSSVEYAYIELFNAGNNNAYYCYGTDADNIQNYHGWMVPGQQLEVPTRELVSIYAVGGTTIAITLLKRVDHALTNYT